MGRRHLGTQTIHLQTRTSNHAQYHMTNSNQICLIHLGEIFVKPLTNKVGPRPLMFSGTVISAVSWIGASFVNDLYQVALLQGLLLGVGNAMV